MLVAEEGVVFVWLYVSQELVDAVLEFLRVFVLDEEVVVGLAAREVVLEAVDLLLQELEFEGEGVELGAGHRRAVVVAEVVEALLDALGDVLRLLQGVPSVGVRSHGHGTPRAGRHREVDLPVALLGGLLRVGPDAPLVEVRAVAAQDLRRGEVLGHRPKDFVLHRVLRPRRRPPRNLLPLVDELHIVQVQALLGQRRTEEEERGAPQEELLGLQQHRC
mmetsp:Transcript_10578/g.34955  ORF Transcript_10578/g.34955 Transcript_10578/m.34955 type:complete len:219 (-) Transcript_10578:1920-2576(-)